MWIRDRRIAAIGFGTAILLAIGLVVIVWYARPGTDERPGAKPKGAETLGGGGVIGGVGLSDTTTPTPTPAGQPSSVQATAGSGGQQNGGTGVGGSTPPRSYPSTSDAYARATLNAWIARDTARLGELATPGALTLMGRAPSGLGGGWEFYDCWLEPMSPCRQLRNDTGNDERVAMLVQGHEAVWFFTNIRRQGDHTAFYDYAEYTSTLDPANRTCVQAWVDGVSWIWAIDRRLLGRAHALVWAGGEQVC
jgi:hypothetical protein